MVACRGLNFHVVNAFGFTDILVVHIGERYATPYNLDLKLRCNCVVFKQKKLSQQGVENSVRNSNQEWFLESLKELGTKKSLAKKYEPIPAQISTWCGLALKNVGKVFSSEDCVDKESSVDTQVLYARLVGATV